MEIRKRAWVFAVLGPLPQAAGYIGGPIALSGRGRRHGWRDGRPGALNRLGGLPLIVGASVLGAAIVSHYRAAPEAARVTVVPSYLATGGIYRMTRNPMYLGGALMQAGWAVFFGSVPVGVALVLYVVGIDRVGIPFEERLLHDRFGLSYDTYRRQVPKWIGTRATADRDN